MTDIKALLREAAMVVRLYADTEYADIELANQLEAAAEALVHEREEMKARDLVVYGQSFSRNGERIDPQNVYLALQPAVPEGFVLVPVEPTEAMVQAGLGWREYDIPDHWPVQARIAYGTYRAMLRAAGDSHE